MNYMPTQDVKAEMVGHPDRLHAADQRIQVVEIGPRFERDRSSDRTAIRHAAPSGCSGGCGRASAADCRPAPCRSPTAPEPSSPSGHCGDLFVGSGGNPKTTIDFAWSPVVDSTPSRKSSWHSRLITMKQRPLAGAPSSRPGASTTCIGRKGGDMKNGPLPAKTNDARIRNILIRDIQTI